MWTDRKDSRVFGAVLAALGLCVLLLLIWDRLETGDTNMSLLIGGFTLVMAGSLVSRTRSKKDESDAG